MQGSVCTDADGRRGFVYPAHGSGLSLRDLTQATEMEEKVIWRLQSAKILSWDALDRVGEVAADGWDPERL